MLKVTWSVHVQFIRFIAVLISSSTMPSDAKKRAQQKKKEQAGNRNKKPIAKVTPGEQNGTETNGTAKEDRELTTEGTFYLSVCL